MKTTILGLLLILSINLYAQNPIVQTHYTTDPAPMVYNNTAYVFTGVDEPEADFFHMYEWRLYASDDMVNWLDCGSPLSLSNFSWACDRAWAGQCVERNGKFYWYICAQSKLTNTMAIGVAVADKITGPYKDAIGKPLTEGNWDYIDPTVFVDDDGSAWLMWGNPHIYYVKLNNNMISFEGKVNRLNETESGFGAPDPELRQKDVKYKDCYTEGPWLSKRNGKYQLLYAAGGVPEHIAYSTADNITGPYTYAGEIMPLEETKSFTNHCGVTDYKGHSYFFYHTGKLPRGGGFNRSVAVEEFVYNSDGSFPVIHHTDAGVNPIETFNPYKKRVQAECMAFSKGITTQCNKKNGVYVSDIHNGDYIKLRNVDFGNSKFKIAEVFAASGLRGGKINFCVDSIANKPFACVNVSETDGWESFKSFNAEVNKAPTGIHDLYLVFEGQKGCKLFNFDFWILKQ